MSENRADILRQDIKAQMMMLVEEGDYTREDLIDIIDEVMEAQS